MRCISSELSSDSDTFFYENMRLIVFQNFNILNMNPNTDLDTLLSNLFVSLFVVPDSLIDEDKVATNLTMWVGLASPFTDTSTV